MKVAVTGGCGFIGANLAKRLAADDNDLTLIDNYSRGNKAFVDASVFATIIEADIRDTGRMCEILEGHEAVIHLAAFGSVVDSVENPVENFSVNVGGTFSVLQAARHARIKKLIFASTGGALIGNTAPPVNESSVPRPISPYGASKLAGEGYCCAFAHAYNINVVVLRFANVVGPISWHKKGAIVGFFKAILHEQPMRIFGDGSATRDFVYIEDICAGISSALQADVGKFDVFHLASGREVSIRELAQMIRITAGVPNHPNIFESARAGEVERNFASFDLARDRLGFSPRYRLEDGLALTWEWFQAEYARQRHHSEMT